MPSKPPKGRRFAKGKSGNPKGSSAKAKTLGKIAQLTAQQVAQIGTFILEGDREALDKIGKDPSASVLQLWTVALIVKSMQKGDPAAYRAVLDRIVGKPKESIEMTGKDGAPVSLDVTDRRQLTEKEMLERADKLAKQRAEAGDD
jgi:hypothetical protein